MLVRVGLSIGGDKQYLRAFNAYDHEAADLSSPMGDVGQIVLHSVGQQFDTEGAHSGDPWAPLTAAYAGWKLAHFGAAPLLVATGETRHEMLDPGAVTVSRRAMTYEPKGQRVEQGIPGYHQFGKGHNPARRMVDLNSGDRRLVDRAFAEWLNRIRHESGLGSAA